MGGMTKRRRIEAPATDYELLTYEGRVLCDEQDLAGGYCGSVPLSGHVQQMRDPKSWVHSSEKQWAEVATRQRGGKEPFPCCRNVDRVSDLRAENAELRAKAERYRAVVDELRTYIYLHPQGELAHVLQTLDALVAAERGE